MNTQKYHRLFVKYVIYTNLICEFTNILRIFCKNLLFTKSRNTQIFTQIYFQIHKFLYNLYLFYTIFYTKYITNYTNSLFFYTTTFTIARHKKGPQFNTSPQQWLRFNRRMAKILAILRLSERIG